MKSKHLLPLIVLAGALSGAAWFLNRHSTNPWSTQSTGAGGKVLEFPINDVTQITIQSKSGAVNLARKDAIWTVRERADYPANFQQISELLRKLYDLKSTQVVPIGPSQLPRLELVDPATAGASGTATKLELKDQSGKALGVLLVGKIFTAKRDFGMGEPMEMPAGRFLMPLGGKAYSLVSDPLDEVLPKPENWLQHDFIKIENPSSITLAGPTPVQHWKVTRESASGEWKLDGATAEEKLDGGKVSQFATALANPSFTDVRNPGEKSAPPVEPAKPGEPAKPAVAAEPPTVLTFQTFDGFTYILKIGQAVDGNLPVDIAVSAEFPKARTPGKDEKPEDKKRLDDEFVAKQKGLSEKLAEEKKLESRTYLVLPSTFDPLIKDRSALFPDKAPPEGANPPTGLPGLPGSPAQLPPGMFPLKQGGPGAALPKPPSASATTPPAATPAIPAPVKTPQPPITATTPPITIPASPKNPEIPEGSKPGTPLPVIPPVTPAPTPAAPAPASPAPAAPNPAPATPAPPAPSNPTPPAPTTPPPAAK